VKILATLVLTATFIGAASMHTGLPVSANRQRKRGLVRIYNLPLRVCWAIICKRFCPTATK
jgi:hypothetical protein